MTAVVWPHLPENGPFGAVEVGQKLARWLRRQFRTMLFL